MENENNALLRYVRVGVWLIGALLAVVCLALLLAMPRVLRTFDHMETVLTEVDELSVKADKALETAIDALESANTVAGNANQLVEDNADAVSEAMEKFNSVDFVALNKAINDLADIVEPLARVSNFFSGNN